MAISAINSVSFRGNKRIEREDIKKTAVNSYNSRHVSSPLKAVPLAVLLAMSPMNTLSETYKNQNFNTDNIEQVQPDKKVLNKYEYKDATYSGHKCEIFLVSTDGDDSNTEKVDLIFTRSTRINTMINKDGRTTKVPAIKTVSDMLTIDTLKTVNVTTSMPDGTTKKYHKYYVSGPGIHRMVTEDLEGVKKYRDNLQKKPNILMEIKPELFEILSKFMGDEVNRKTESVFDNSLF